VLIGGETWGAFCYPVNALIAGKIDWSQDPPGFDTNGASRLPASFLDGTSNTILHAEKYARCTSNTLPARAGDGGSVWGYSIDVFTPAPMPPLRPIAPGFVIPAWATRGAPDCIGPRSKFQLQPSPHQGNCDPTRAATAHPGGMPVCLADGSVRTLSPGMSGQTWWAACTPAGGEVLPGDW
jgi:prepilin-type processing-associated H-X9-DG protein